MTHDFGRFVWFEHIAEDSAKAQAFYGEVMGWKAQAMDMEGMPPYSMIVVGEASVGGYAKPPKAGIPPHWVSYVSVADVDATAKKIVSLGGKAIMDAFDVPNIGRMQPVAAPDGATFFLFHGADGDKDALKGNGAFHWNELATPEPEKAVAFYEKALGYTHESMEMPDGTYFVLKSGDSPRGGVMKSPAPNVPAGWVQYVTVDDVDAAIARAKASGGKALTDAMDVPGVGRFAHVKDPLGAVIGVITPAETSS